MGLQRNAEMQKKVERTISKYKSPVIRPKASVSPMNNDQCSDHPWTSKAGTTVGEISLWTGGMDFRGVYIEPFLPSIESVD